MNIFVFFPFRFCIINAGVLYVYFSSFQQIDEEEYGGTWELTKEGFMTSFALFLVRMLMFRASFQQFFVCFSQIMLIMSIKPFVAPWEAASDLINCLQ